MPTVTLSPAIAALTLKNNFEMSHVYTKFHTATNVTCTVLPWPHSTLHLQLLEHLTNKPSSLPLFPFFLFQNPASFSTGTQWWVVPQRNIHMGVKYIQWITVWWQAATGVELALHTPRQGRTIHGGTNYWLCCTEMNRRISRCTACPNRGRRHPTKTTAMSLTALTYGFQDHQGACHVLQISLKVEQARVSCGRYKHDD